MTAASVGRVAVDGKHLAVNGRPFRVRGVTYGSFVPRLDGDLFPERSAIKVDLAEIARAGLNTVRTYSLPPVEVFDVAAELGLRLIVGLHYDDWRMEMHAGRAAARRVLDNGRRAIDTALERCSGREEVLAISVGNEVPSDLVRLHGIRSVESTLSHLAGDVHAGDEHMLATYSNYPTTEYLHIDGQDFACFNVFLERKEQLRAYLRHLQVAAGDLPVVISELGLASGLHGEAAQAASLGWQLREVDEAGVAGATIFAYTDEWGVAGRPVDGWGFGITTAGREPKQAFGVVRDWARQRLGDIRDSWPSISVVVCAYNEERSIDWCLRSLDRSDYPNLEVILCDDGSIDHTVRVARAIGGRARILELPHAGLSAARNAGLAAAGGEIVAFLDADAACHPDWPYHLALSLEEPGVVATGGPNLPVAGAGLVERAVALSPGGPTHVLIADDRAEHVPGCNMAFKRPALLDIGGFDVSFVSAGDDVDVCWKLIDAGGQIAFSAAAQVRHRRRGTVGGYLRQQRGYGRSERMVAGRHPHRFNRLGQARWAGSIYGGPRVLPSLLRPVIYHGYLGSAPFQGVAARRSELAVGWIGALLPVVVPLAVASAAASLVAPQLGLLTLATVVLIAAFALAVAAAIRPARAEPRPLALRALVATFHVIQPLVRAWGRVRATPLAPIDRVSPSWTGDRFAWLDSLRRALVERACHVRPGAPDAPWDIEASAGPLLAARLTTAVAWSWTPKHQTRYRLRPRAAWWALLLIAAALWRPTLAETVAAITAVELSVEAIRLRRKVSAAVASSIATA